MKKNTDDGAKIYTPLTLKLYDWWVLGVSNRLAWGCPTKEHLLPHFLEHLGNNHLDIGVGTGFYLTHVPESSLISLMDLNEASLNAASTRAGESKIKHKISHDVFEPYPAALHGQFDSISMFYLLHCLPGNISTKSCVIRNAAQALTDDGTLYGATILPATGKLKEDSCAVCPSTDSCGVADASPDAEEEESPLCEEEEGVCSTGKSSSFFPTSSP